MYVTLSVWFCGDVGHLGAGTIECATNPMPRLGREVREASCAVDGEAVFVG